LLDLQCSASDAPIVTPYRLRTHRRSRKRIDRDAPSRETGFVLGVGADVALRPLMGSNEAALVAAFLLG